MKKKMLGMMLVTIFAFSLAAGAYAYYYETMNFYGSLSLGTFYGELSLWGFGEKVEIKDVGAIVAVLSDYLEPNADPQLAHYPQTLTVDITGAYPWYYAWFEWDLHWYGTVPSHLYVECVSDPLPDYVKVHHWITSVEFSQDDDLIDPDDYTLWDDALPWQAQVEYSMTTCELGELLYGTQWHACNDVKIMTVIVIVEIDEWMLQDPDYEWEILTYGSDLLSPIPGGSYDYDCVFHWYQFDHPEQPGS